MMPQPKNSAIAVAVSLLARRDHSERELSDKLVQRGYSLEDVNGALQRVRERGYVNDIAYCNKLAESLWQSGKWGLLGLANQLRSRGLSESIIREAMAALDRDQELAHANAILEKRAFKPTEREKAGRFLAARGFSFSVIGQAIRDFFLER